MLDAGDPALLTTSDKEDAAMRGNAGTTIQRLRMGDSSHDNTTSGSVDPTAVAPNFGLDPPQGDNVENVDLGQSNLEDFEQFLSEQLLNDIGDVTDSFSLSSVSVNEPWIDSASLDVLSSSQTHQADEPPQSNQKLPRIDPSSMSQLRQGQQQQQQQQPQTQQAHRQKGQGRSIESLGKRPQQRQVHTQQQQPQLLGSISPTLQQPHQTLHQQRPQWQYPHLQQLQKSQSQQGAQPLIAPTKQMVIEPQSQSSASSQSVPTKRPNETAVTDSETLSEYPHLHRTHHTLGYSDGMAAGRANAVQSAFDAAFPRGLSYGIRAGKVLGCLEFAFAGRCKPGEFTIMQAARRELNMDNLIADIMVEIEAGCDGYVGWPTDETARAAWNLANGVSVDPETTICPDPEDLADSKLAPDLLAALARQRQHQPLLQVPSQLSQSSQTSPLPPHQWSVSTSQTEPSSQFQTSGSQPAQVNAVPQNAQASANLPQNHTSLQPVTPSAAQNQQPSKRQRSLPAGLRVIRHGPPANTPGFSGHPNPAASIADAILRWEMLTMNFVTYKEQLVTAGKVKRSTAGSYT